MDDKKESDGEMVLRKSIFSNSLNKVLNRDASG